MTVLEQLLEYQKVDADLRKIEQSVAGSEERKKFSQAKKFMESAREKLEAQDKRASELRRLRDDLVRRAEEIGKQIAEYSDIDEMVDEEGGDISFYKKNAQALLDRLRAVKGELAKLTSDVNAAVEEYDRFKKQTIAMQKQGEEYSKKFKELKNAHAAEADAISDLPHHRAAQRRPLYLRHGFPARPTGQTCGRERRRVRALPQVRL